MNAKTEAPVVEATIRTVGKAKALRRTGSLPAVVYGNVKENLHISLETHGFSKILDHVGYSTILALKIADKPAIKVLVQDAVHHPLTNDLMHVDFFAVNLKEKLTTEVPIEFTGVADAVELLGGIFVTVKSEIEIECLPDNLPQHIEVDISMLKGFDDSIRIKDLVLPEGVEATAEPDEVVAAITEPISEEELAKLDEAPESTEPTTEFETTSGTDKTEEEGAEKKAE